MEKGKQRQHRQISTSLCMVLIRGNLIIPKIWCYFYVKVPLLNVILLEKSSISTSKAGGKVELFTDNSLWFFFNLKDRCKSLSTPQRLPIADTGASDTRPVLIFDGTEWQF